MTRKYFTKLLLFFCFCVSHILSAENPVLILIGPPGTGKGTFAQYLKENHHYTHLSSGDLIRDEIDMQTDIGKKIAEIVRAGDYIDPAIMHAILAKHITSAALSDGPFIIDNFGRSQHDIDFLCNILSNLDLLNRTCVLFLEADDAICRERIAYRLVCNTCHHVYNSLTNQPNHPGLCDLCRTPLKRRLNDTSDVIEKRLYDYRKNIEPCYKYLATLYPSITYKTEKPIEECLQWCNEQRWNNNHSLIITGHQ